MEVLVVFPILILMVASTANSSCYFPDGTPAGDSFTRCYISESFDSWCCETNSWCYSGGLCMRYESNGHSSIQQFYLGACSDSNWESNQCPSFCQIDSYAIQDGPNDIQSCNAQQNNFCCDDQMGVCDCAATDNNNFTLPYSPVPFGLIEAVISTTSGKAMTVASVSIMPQYTSLMGTSITPSTSMLSTTPSSTTTQLVSSSSVMTETIVIVSPFPPSSTTQVTSAPVSRASSSTTPVVSTSLSNILIPVPTPTPTPSSSSNAAHSAAIGGAVGGLVLLTVCISYAWYFSRTLGRKKAMRAQRLQEQLEYLESNTTDEFGTLEKPMDRSSLSDVIVRYGPGLPARSLQWQAPGTTTAEAISPAQVFHSRFYG